MEICSGASKELTIENGINMIVDTWRVQRFEVIKYMKGPHERGLILRPNEELTQTLEDQMMNLSSMMSSRFVAPFLELTQKWEKLMSTISEARTAYSMRSSSASACAMLLPLVLRCVGHRGVVQGSEQMDVRKGCSQISDLARHPLLRQLSSGTLKRSSSVLRIFAYNCQRRQNALIGYKQPSRRSCRRRKRIQMFSTRAPPRGGSPRFRSALGASLSPTMFGASSKFHRALPDSGALRSTGSVPEVSLRLPRDEAHRLPAVLLSIRR
jgi:hypothetical protein